jgi:hypothetical protein
MHKSIIASVLHDTQISTKKDEHQSEYENMRTRSSSQIYASNNQQDINRISSISIGSIHGIDRADLQKCVSMIKPEIVVSHGAGPQTHPDDNLIRSLYQLPVERLPLQGFLTSKANGNHKQPYHRDVPPSLFELHTTGGNQFSLEPNKLDRFNRMLDGLPLGARVLCQEE